jgi:hypothetical protein
VVGYLKEGKNLEKEKGLNVHACGCVIWTLVARVNCTLDMGLKLWHLDFDIQKCPPLLYFFTCCVVFYNVITTLAILNTSNVGLSWLHWLWMQFQ